EVTEVVEAAARRRPAVILPNDGRPGLRQAAPRRRLVGGRVHPSEGWDGSLARTLLWGAAWDTVRDGEASAAWFVDLVLANVGHERDSSVVQTLLRQLATAIGLYLPEDQAEAVRVAAADRLWGLVAEAEDGSDNQLQFVKAFALHARTTAQLDRLAALVTAPAPCPGWTSPRTCAGSCSLRWWRQPCREAEIAEAERADATATGALAAIQARAAVPTAEAKRAAWDRVMAGELSNTEQRQALIGFARVHDAALIAPFADSYFEGVEAMWDSRSHEMAETAATLGYPTAQVTRRSPTAPPPCPSGWPAPARGCPASSPRAGTRPSAPWPRASTRRRTCIRSTPGPEPDGGGSRG
ncbi:hypothetical protein GS444_24840, partial [Rhodococcus hoagii]|nr:hypothetical protein [Prescottella equi]